MSNSIAINTSQNSVQASLSHSNARNTSQESSKQSIASPSYRSEAQKLSSQFTDAADSFQNSLSTFLGSMISNLPKGPKLEKTLNAEVQDGGKLVVSTEDQFKVRFEGERQAWVIEDPSGNSTEIWGDPHVVESDGTKWDFLNTSSFLFGNNKVTVETVPAWNGQSFSSKVTIYNGQERISVSNVENDDIKLAAWDFDATKQDALLDDGDVYRLTPGENGNFSWKKE